MKHLKKYKIFVEIKNDFIPIKKVTGKNREFKKLIKNWRKSLAKE